MEAAQLIVLFDKKIEEWTHQHKFCMTRSDQLIIIFQVMQLTHRKSVLVYPEINWIHTLTGSRILVKQYKPQENQIFPGSISKCGASIGYPTYIFLVNIE